MEKTQIKRIVSISTLALIIPLIGQLFVEGWNWGVMDFVFAWVFFNVLGFVYSFVTNSISNRAYRILAGVVVVAAFVLIWVVLATG
jgi:hypothetical protein